MTTTLERKKTKIKLRPLGDRVVVERDEAEERTAGGIVLPDKAKEKINRGKVIAVGDGRWDDKGNRVPMQVKTGDRVLFSKYGGDDFKPEEEEYLLIRETDILAVIE
jgi:chaperonin GroES